MSKEFVQERSSISSIPIGTSEAAFYNWKLKYGGMEASDVKRLKDLESEHFELKKMHVEVCIENRAMKTTSLAKNL